mgnify:CR=1 FL=1
MTTENYNWLPRLRQLWPYILALIVGIGFVYDLRSDLDRVQAQQASVQTEQGAILQSIAELRTETASIKATVLGSDKQIDRIYYILNRYFPTP